MQRREFHRVHHVLLLFASLFWVTRGAHAFTHVVQRGETLAQIAERIYGRIPFEKVLVTANALDAQGGAPIVPGERLEVPALGHRRVAANETWGGLALALLGDADRAEFLAKSNDLPPWTPPAEGAEIVIPYNLRYIVGPTDTLALVAQKFSAEKDFAWIIDRFNHLKGQPIRRGDVLLIPLTDLPLTTAGKEEALSAEGQLRSETAGGVREAQRRADGEMPSLLSDVRGGRYVDAITRGSRMLALGDLTKLQLAVIHRQLVEAYVALEAPGLAASSCIAWRQNDPKFRLDPAQLSPKVIEACPKSQP